ncbi:MAG: four helix bundle protein [Pseudomonadota bacterium]
MNAPKLNYPIISKINFFAPAVALLSIWVEGRGKRTPKDQRRFFDIAFGSVREVQSVLDLANAKDDIVIFADKTAAHLYKLIKFLS